MALYIYKATDSSQELVEGTIEAQTEEEAIERIKQMGYSPVEVFSERRAYPRLDSSVNVRYKLIGDKEELKEKDMHLEKLSITMNISGGGIALTVPEELSVSSIIDLEIDLPDGKDLIRCLGKVAWTKKLAQSFYEVGLCFLDITGEERTRIGLYVTK